MKELIKNNQVTSYIPHLPSGKCGFKTEELIHADISVRLSPNRNPSLSIQSA